jgi:hypothetical protein
MNVALFHLRKLHSINVLNTTNDQAINKNFKFSLSNLTSSAAANFHHALSTQSRYYYKSESWGPGSVLFHETKYIESWPNTTSAWAGWSRFDIPVDRYDGVHSLPICTSSTLGFPPCHQSSQQDNTY